MQFFLKKFLNLTSTPIRNKVKLCLYGEKNRSYLKIILNLTTGPENWFTDNSLIKKHSLTCLRIRAELIRIRPIRPRNKQDLDLTYEKTRIRIEPHLYLLYYYNDILILYYNFIIIKK